MAGQGVVLLADQCVEFWVLLLCFDVGHRLTDDVFLRCSYWRCGSSYEGRQRGGLYIPFLYNVLCVSHRFSFFLSHSHEISRPFRATFISFARLARLRHSSIDILTFNIDYDDNPRMFSALPLDVTQTPPPFISLHTRIHIRLRLRRPLSLAALLLCISLTLAPSFRLPSTEIRTRLVTATGVFSRTHSFDQ